MTTNNQPAHGPVSLDRLHQISEMLSKAAVQSDGGNLGYAMADAVKVIDSIIAAANAKSIVPDELLSAMEEVLRISDRDHEAWHKARNGIASCRAAMLQSFGNSEQLNSPVIPDGYVLVPKEMTPEMMRAVQIKSELGGYAASELSGAYDMFREFWDVAVSEAPQQEVK